MASDCDAWRRVPPGAHHLGGNAGWPVGRLQNDALVVGYWALRPPAAATASHGNELYQQGSPRSQCRRYAAAQSNRAGWEPNRLLLGTGALQAMATRPPGSHNPILMLRSLVATSLATKLQHAMLSWSRS